jgi:hypothetical protein
MKEGESFIENVECVISTGGQKKDSFIPESPVLFYNVKWSEKYKRDSRGFQIEHKDNQ